MTEQDLRELIGRQKEWLREGNMRTADARIQALKKLSAVIARRESEICGALEKDLGKSPSESYMCEIGLVQSEITFMIRHIRRYMRERRVPTPLAQYVSRSFVKPSPLGTVLIMSPWNYPFLLSIEPLVDAVSAGNTVLLKPSAYAPASAAIMKEIVGEAFPEEHAAVITGGREENKKLLEQKYDLIFFTGSQSVGKVVLEHAAKNLTPAVLELGGKSPCIVDQTAKIPLAAKRIVWGKFLNCGQTCVAPDYILCHEDVKDKLLEEIIRQIKVQFDIAPLGNPSYGKIINEKHYDRLRALIDPEKVIYGGDSDRQSLMIEPTVMDNVTWDDPVMQEEIFGPLLPVLTYRSLGEVISMLGGKQKPLACYIFSENRKNIRRVLTECSFGGGCVNDTIIHLATSAMGFGGVGESGMGAYHGKDGFRTFSHEKRIVDKKTWMDLPMRYQPFTALHDKLIRMFIH